ncbi:MAG TPA: hypothetical protein VFL46_02095 [Phycicoccus sp.]|nr:hypothetical protein [Phycicoccus sp.]
MSADDDRTAPMPRHGAGTRERVLREDEPADTVDHGGRGQHGETVPFEQRIHDDERLAREEHVHRDARDVHDGYPAQTHAEVLATEREHFGGVKVGAAFFGWLTATGLAVLLTAALAAAGTAVGLSNGTTPDQVAADAANSPQSVGLLGAVALGVVVFVAYYCGGYVAGRMARFDGARQGVAVWLWAVLVAIVVGVLGALAGARFDVLASVDVFPRVPLGEGELTTAGIVAAVVVLVTSLVGAVLGGLAGMRFHRRVDRVGLGA